MNRIRFYKARSDIEIGDETEIRLVMSSIGCTLVLIIGHAKMSNDTKEANRS